MSRAAIYQLFRRIPDADEASIDAAVDELAGQTHIEERMTTELAHLEERITMKLAHLEERMAEMATKAELASLRTELAHLKEQMATMATKEELAHLEERINERIDGLEERINERMAAMAQQMATKADMDKVSTELKLLRWMFSLMFGLLMALILGVIWILLGGSS